jgi:hypothetical protein
VTVNFQAQTAGSGATASLSATSAVTDSSGLASITATANSVGGIYAVVANVTGAPTSASFTLANDGGATIDVQDGSPQTATVGTAFATSLQAIVLDGTGTPIQGSVVTFQAPASGATATLNGASACVPAAAGCRTAITDPSGVATLNATAGLVSGTYAVLASTSDAPMTVGLI